MHKPCYRRHVRRPRARSGNSSECRMQNAQNALHGSVAWPQGRTAKREVRRAKSSWETAAPGCHVRAQGRGRRDKGRATRDEGQGTRDEGATAVSAVGRSKIEVRRAKSPPPVPWGTAAPGCHGGQPPSAGRKVRRSQGRKVARSQEPPRVPRLCQPCKPWGPAAPGWPSKGEGRRTNVESASGTGQERRAKFEERNRRRVCHDCVTRGCARVGPMRCARPAEGGWPPWFLTPRPSSLVPAPWSPSCLRASPPSCPHA